MTGTTRDARPSTVSHRLDHLFLTVHPVGAGPYTYRAAADAINALAGRTVISAPYLQQIRSGRRPAPSMEKLVWIAKFFGVPVAYFTDDEVARRVDEDIQALAEQRDSGQALLRLITEGLAPEALAPIIAVALKARRAAGLPDVTLV